MADRNLPPLEDLLKPLSAKVQRPKWTSGGQEMTVSKARMGEANALRARLAQRQVDAERRKRGTL